MAEVREQHDWLRVLKKLPKRLQAQAKEALHEIMYAASRDEAEEAIEQFDRAYFDRYSDAAASLRRDEQRLLTFFDFPAVPFHAQWRRPGRLVSGW